MAYRVVNEVDAVSDGSVAHAKAGQETGGSVKSTGRDGGSSVAGTGGGIGAGVNGQGQRKMDEEEERDAVFFRLEMLGYRVGQGLVERCVQHHFKLCFSLPSSKIHDTGELCRLGEGDA